MMTISDYMSVPFYDGDKGMRGMNCGVFINNIRENILGKAPVYAGLISKDDNDEIDKAFSANLSKFKEGKRHGSIACVFDDERLVHVGVLLDLDEGWRVVHIAEGTGVRKDKLRVFEFMKTVRYFYD